MTPGLNSPAFRARFTREIELTSVLQHPHIVPILAAEECLFVPDSPQDLCYYVMPYVEGESLRHRLLCDGRLPFIEALKITREVAGALQFAHARQIIHRDLKPENILLDGAHALLADFGVARAISFAQDPSLTSEGVVVGSLAYMSPEQMAGMSLDPRTDIYALGCVFHEMITGTTPLLTPGSSSRPGFPVFRQALLDQKIGRAVVRGLEQVLCQALSPELEQRYSTVEQFTTGLEQALQPSLKDRLAALLVPQGRR